MTQRVTKPIALDKSFNTTGLNPQNIADVLADKLQGIKEAIENGADTGGAFIVSYGSTTAQQIYDAIRENKVPYLYYNGVVAQLWKVETNKYTFRTTETRVVDSQTYLDIIDYSVTGVTWDTDTKTISGGGGGQTPYFAKASSVSPFDTTGKSGSQEVVYIDDVPEDGVYQVSVLMGITPQIAAASKSDLVFKIVSAGSERMNNSFHAIVDDSDLFAQQVSFSLSLTLKAGRNSLVLECDSLTTSYLISVDIMTIASLVNGSSSGGGGESNPFMYDTLQAAISDVASLPEDAFFQTNGRFTAGDGGAALYKIDISSTPNAMDIVDMGSGKRAVLQVQGDALYPEQLGYVPTKVYADRVDCTPIFNRIWNLCSTVKLRKARYWFNDYVTLPLGGKIIGENIYGDDVSEMSTYRSGDYFVYCENRENVIENVVLSNRHNNGNLSPVSTGGVGIRSNEWLHDGAAHFDYVFHHLRLMGFRKGMELQGTTKWAVTLNDIRCSQCYIGIEFGEASFNIDLHKIYTDHCTYAGINFHGEGVFGFYDCNLGSINTAVKISEYSGSQYNDILLTFVNTNFECDDQTVTNIPGLYFDIDDALDVILNLYGCRFMQNAGVYTASNRCMKLGAKTLVNIKGCEVRNNTGSAQVNDNFWNENYPCKFVLGAIRISDNCRGIPTPQFTDSKYDLCCVSTDLSEIEIVSQGGGGTPGNNLWDNSSPITLAGYVSEANTEHPNGFFTLNNSVQITLAIPITNDMQGQTIRISAGSTSHNRWKYGKISAIPTESITDLTYVNTASTEVSGRIYSDITVGASETGYILLFFGSGISATDIIADCMACVSPYYTPYEAYQGGTTTYSRRLLPSLIDLNNLVPALNSRGSLPCYSSLQAAIVDASSLPVGAYFETNGFHSSGDGGAARYYVSSNGTANGKNIVQLAPGKNAYLQYGEWVCPEELGYNHSDDVVPYITHAISTMGVQHIKLLTRGTYHWKTMLNVNMINGFELVGEGDWGHPRKFTYINVDPTSDITCMMKISGRSITLKNLDIEVTGTQALAIDGITCDSYSDGAEFYFNFDNIRMNSFKECWKLSGGIKWHVMFNECQPANCTIGIHIQESSSMLINMKEVYFNHCSNIGLWFEGNVFTAKMDSCNFGSMNTAVKCSVNSSTYLYQNLRFDSCNFEDDNVSVGNRAAVFFDCYDSEHLDTRQNITISNSNFTLAKSSAPEQDVTNRYFRLGKKTNLLFINNQILGMDEPNHPEWIVYPKLFWNTSVLPTQGSVVEVGNNLFFDYPNAFLPYVVRNGQSLGVNCYNAKDPTETAWTDCDTFLPRYNGEMRVARVSTFENTANMPTTGIFGYLMAFGVIENPNPRVLQVLFASNNNVYTRIIRDTGSGWTVLAWKTITAT